MARAHSSWLQPFSQTSAWTPSLFIVSLLMNGALSSRARRLRSGPVVVPQDRGADATVRRVQQQHTVHLAGEANGLNTAKGLGMPALEAVQAGCDRRPPGLRIILGPARTRLAGTQALFDGCNRLLASVDQHEFNRRGPNIDPDEHRPSTDKSAGKIGRGHALTLAEQDPPEVAGPERADDHDQQQEPTPKRRREVLVGTELVQPGGDHLKGDQGDGNGEHPAEAAKWVDPPEKAGQHGDQEIGLAVPDA